MKTLYPYLAATLLALFLPARPAYAAETEASPTARTLEFIENKGQWDARSRYEAELHGGRLFLQTTGLRLIMGQPADLPGHGEKAPTTSSKPAPPADAPVRAHALELEFVGAAPARLTAQEPTNEHRNYFIGADPGRWASDVRSYRQVRYAGLWPGVAARVYENAGQQLEYDFELAAGADAGLIAVRHHGAEALHLDAEGNLLVKTSVGTLTEQAPQAWQTDAQGRRQPVSCRYVLKNNVLRFALGRYNHRRPLTIDPVVVFSTYSGATSTNWGFTATHDRQGNLYSGGIVFTFGFLVTTGAFQTTFRGQTDMALTKYDIARNGAASRVWATLIGGNDWDFPHSLVVNSQGELLIMGSSSSTTYPTTAGAIQRQFGGGSPADPFGDGRFNNTYEVTNGTDIVVSRLSATGAALLSSTYLGGSGNDGLVPLSPNSTALQLPHNYGDAFRGDIIVDAQNNVYIASSTTGSFPATASFNPLYRGGTSDGLVCKLTPGLTSVLWAGLLGGAGADAAYSLQLEPGTGDVYVTGGTLSANFPTTPGSYRPGRPGNVDGFVARIAADGRRIVRATYLGTADYDQAYFLQLGADGGVYVLGQTVGTYPTTPGLYRTFNGSQFIHKLDANLGTTQLATVFGNGSGEVNISPTAFLVDQCDRVFVCGWGGGGNANDTKAYLSLNGSVAGLPTTASAMQRVTDGRDFYLAQFTAGLTGLGYATYYGSPSGEGDHVDGGTSRFDPRGVVYQAVCACFSATGFPIPPGANSFSASSGSPAGCNNAAFVFDFQPAIATAGGDQTVCATAAPLALTGTPAGGIWSGPGVSGSVGTGFYFTAAPGLLGVQNLTYTVVGTGLCTSTAGRRVTVVAPPVVTFNLSQTNFCITSATPTTLPLTGSPAGGTFSGAGVRGSVAAGFTFTPALVVSSGTHTLTYTYTGPGCTSHVNRTVSVLRADAGAAQTLCSITAPFALQGSPAGGTWSGPGVSGSAGTGFVFTPANAPVGTSTLRYSITDPVSGCISESSRTVQVLNVARLAVTPVPTRCTTDTAPVLLQGSPAGGNWAGPGVYVSGGSYYLSPTAQPGTVTLRYFLPSQFCPQEAPLAVTTLARPQPALPADTTLCPGSTRPFALRGSPAGGTWTGAGVSGNATTGYVFTPPPGFAGAALVYTVANGSCPGTATRRVSVTPEPSLLPDWTPVACVQDRQAPLLVRFTAPAVPGILSWDFGDDSPAATGFSVTHTYTGAGRYQPRATLRYFDARCVVQVALAPIEVQDQAIPNVITPGTDDQLNQAFRLPPGCPPRLQLFSRWGQRVFEAATYQNDWSAQNQPGGLYYYLLAYPDGHRVRGWLEVIK